MMPLLVVAIGQTFVLIVAGIDLSAISILPMSSVLAAAVMTMRRRPAGDGRPWLADRRRHRHLHGRGRR